MAQEAAFAAPELKKFFPADPLIASNPNLDLEWAKTFLPKMPPSVAVVEDAWRSKVPDARTLVLIQDAHANESGQWNLAKALDAVLQKENIRTVYAEAAFGDSSLNFFKQFGGPEIQKKAAAPFVERAELQGDEFLNLIAPYDFTLWGVEDERLYGESVELYREVVKGRDGLKDYLKKIRSTADALRPHVLNPALEAFDEKIEAYAGGGLAVSEYARYLADEARYRGVSPEAYPHLKALAALFEKESGIDFAAAARQEALACASLSDEDRRTLADAMKRQGPSKILKLDADEKNGFFARLEEKLGRRAGDFPELKKYFDYLKSAAAIDPREVPAELDRLEAALLEKLAVSPDEKTFIRCQKNLRLFGKLADLDLTPADYAAYRAGHDEDLAHITGFLNKKIMELGRYYEYALFYERRHEKTIQKAEAFYALTFRRDEHFLSEMTARMDAKGESRAVLITGGFHARHLKALLREKGISFVSLAPTVLEETNRPRYERLLLSQNAPTPTPFTPPAPGMVPAANLGLLYAVAKPWILSQYARALGIPSEKMFAAFKEARLTTEGTASPVLASEGARLAHIVWAGHLEAPIQHMGMWSAAENGIPIRFAVALNEKNMDAADVPSKLGLEGFVRYAVTSDGQPAGRWSDESTDIRLDPSSMRVVGRDEDQNYLISAVFRPPVPDDAEFIDLNVRLHSRATGQTVWLKNDTYNNNVRIGLPIAGRFMIRADGSAVLDILGERAAEEGRFWNRNAAEEDLLRLLRHENSVGWVADSVSADGQTKVGGFMVYEIHDFWLAVHHFEVRPQWRGRGIETALLKQLRKKISALGRKFLVFWVSPDYPFIDFFREQGCLVFSLPAGSLIVDAFPSEETRAASTRFVDWFLSGQLDQAGSFVHFIFKLADFLIKDGNAEDAVRSIWNRTRLIKDERAANIYSSILNKLRKQHAFRLGEPSYLPILLALADRVDYFEHFYQKPTGLMQVDIGRMMTIVESTTQDPFWLRFVGRLSTFPIANFQGVIANVERLNWHRLEYFGGLDAVMTLGGKIRFGKGRPHFITQVGAKYQGPTSGPLATHSPDWQKVILETTEDPRTLAQEIVSETEKAEKEGKTPTTWQLAIGGMPAEMKTRDVSVRTAERGFPLIALAAMVSMTRPSEPRLLENNPSRDSSSPLTPTIQGIYVTPGALMLYPNERHDIVFDFPKGLDVSVEWFETWIRRVRNLSLGLYYADLYQHIQPGLGVPVHPPEYAPRNKAIANEYIFFERGLIRLLRKYDRYDKRDEAYLFEPKHPEDEREIRGALKNYHLDEVLYPDAEWIQNLATYQPSLNEEAWERFRARYRRVEATLLMRRPIQEDIDAGLPLNRQTRVGVKFVEDMSALVADASDRIQKILNGEPVPSDTRVLAGDNPFIDPGNASFIPGDSRLAGPWVLEYTRRYADRVMQLIQDGKLKPEDVRNRQGVRFYSPSNAARLAAVPVKSGPHGVRAVEAHEPEVPKREEPEKIPDLPVPLKPAEPSRPAPAPMPPMPVPVPVPAPLPASGARLALRLRSRLPLMENGARLAGRNGTDAASEKVFQEIRRQGAVIYLWNARENRKTFDQITDEDLNKLRKSGFNVLWMQGIWRTGKFSEAFNKMWDEKRVASSYSITEYEPAPALGDEKSFMALVDRANRDGLIVMVDVVPAQMAVDSPWIGEIPEGFITSDDPNQPAADLDDYLKGREDFMSHGYGHQSWFFNYRRSDGQVIKLRHAEEDFNHVPMIDTAQANISNPAYQNKLMEAMRHMLYLTNGGALRVDTVHSTSAERMNRVVLGPLDKDEMKAEFWPSARQELNQEFPNAFLLGEAYIWTHDHWLASGMRYTYGDILYNALVEPSMGEGYHGILRNLLPEGKSVPRAIENFLTKTPVKAQRRAVHYLENHDHPYGERVSAKFGSPERQMAAAIVMTAASPGPVMIDNGQMEGRSLERPSAIRVTLEPEKETHDAALFKFYRTYLNLTRRPLFRFAKPEPVSGLERVNDAARNNVIAIRRRFGNEQALVLVNYGMEPADLVLRPDVADWKTSYDFSRYQWRSLDGSKSMPFEDSEKIHLGPWEYQVRLLQEAPAGTRLASFIRQTAHFWFGAELHHEPVIPIDVTAIEKEGFSPEEARTAAGKLEAALRRAYGYLGSHEKEALFQTQKNNRILRHTGEWMELPLALRIVKGLPEEAMVSPSEITLDADMLRAPPAILTLVLLHGLRRSLYRFEPDSQPHDAEVFQWTLQFLMKDGKFLADFDFKEPEDFLRAWEAWRAERPESRFYGRDWDAPFRHARQLVDFDDGWSSMSGSTAKRIYDYLEELFDGIAPDKSIDRLPVSNELALKKWFPTLPPPAVYREIHGANRHYSQKYIYLICDLGDGVRKVVRISNYWGAFDLLTAPDAAASRWHFPGLWNSSAAINISIIRDAQGFAGEIADELELFRRHPDLFTLIDPINALSRLYANDEEWTRAQSAVRQLEIWSRESGDDIGDAGEAASVRERAAMARDMLFSVFKTFPVDSVRRHLNRIVFDQRTGRPLEFPTSMLNYSALNDEDCTVRSFVQGEEPLPEFRFAWNVDGGPIQFSPTLAPTATGRRLRLDWTLPVRQGWAHYALQAKTAADGGWRYVRSSNNLQIDQAADGIVKFVPNGQARRILSVDPFVWNLRFDERGHILVDERGNMAGGTFEDLQSQLHSIKEQGYREIYVKALERGAPGEAGADASPFSVLAPDRIAERLGGWRALMAFKKAADQEGLEVSLDLIPHGSRSDRQSHPHAAVWVWSSDGHRLVRHAGSALIGLEWYDSFLPNFSDPRTVKEYIKKVSRLARAGFNFRLDQGHYFDTTFETTGIDGGMGQLRGEVVGTEHRRTLDLRHTPEANALLAWIIYEVKKAGRESGHSTTIYSECLDGMEERLIKSGVDAPMDPLVENMWEVVVHKRPTQQIENTLRYEERIRKGSGGQTTTLISDHDNHHPPAEPFGAAALSAVAALVFSQGGVLLEHFYHSHERDRQIDWRSVYAETRRAGGPDFPRGNHYGPARIVNGRYWNGADWNGKFGDDWEMLFDYRSGLYHLTGLGKTIRRVHALVKSLKRPAEFLHTNHPRVIGVLRESGDGSFLIGLFHAGHAPFDADLYLPVGGSAMDQAAARHPDAVFALETVADGQSEAVDAAHPGSAQYYTGRELARLGLRLDRALPNLGWRVYRLSRLGAPPSSDAAPSNDGARLSLDAIRQGDAALYAKLLKSSLGRYWKYEPAARWKDSLVASELERALSSADEEAFLKWFRAMLAITGKNTPLGPGDAVPVVEDLKRFQPNEYSAFEDALIRIAAEGESPEERTAAARFLRAAEIGGIVLGTPGKLGAYSRLTETTERLAKALADEGLAVTLITVAPPSADYEWTESSARDSGHIVTVRYNYDSSRQESQAVRLYEGRLGKVRVIYLSNEAYLRDLGRHSTARAVLRFSRMVSLGIPLAAREMGIHYPHYLDLFGGPTAYAKSFLDGDDRISSDFRYDNPFAYAETIFNLYAGDTSLAAELNNGLFRQPLAYAEAQALHDLGLDAAHVTASDGLEAVFAPLRNGAMSADRVRLISSSPQAFTGSFFEKYLKPALDAKKAGGVVTVVYRPSVKAQADEWLNDYLYWRPASALDKKIRARMDSETDAFVKVRLADLLSRLSPRPRPASTGARLAAPHNLWAPGRKSAFVAVPTAALSSSRGHGIGDELDRRALIDVAASVGFQLQDLPDLPTGPDDPSPYSAKSSIGLDPLKIALEIVPDVEKSAEARALIRQAEENGELAALRSAKLIDFKRVRAFKISDLRAAFGDFMADEWGKGTPRDEDFRQFMDTEKDWLDDFALFFALKEKTNWKPWWEWDPAIRRHEAAALESWRENNANEVLFQKYLEWVRLRQDEDTTTYRRDRGVFQKGDISIYIARDSVDVWAHPELFDAEGEGGAPPDAYSWLGQGWGTPTYDWAQHAKTGYAWWIRRVRFALRFNDVLRLDHFRGFESYWRIPQASSTKKAVEDEVAADPATFGPSDEAAGQALSRSGPIDGNLLDVLRVHLMKHIGWGGDALSVYPQLRQIWPAELGLLPNEVAWNALTEEARADYVRKIWDYVATRQKSRIDDWTALSLKEDPAPGVLYDRLLAPWEKKFKFKFQEKMPKWQWVLLFPAGGRTHVFRQLDAGWVRGPGDDFMQALLGETTYKDLASFIAEDLGTVDDAVEALKNRSGLPGMRVIQFGWGPETDHVTGGIHRYVEAAPASSQFVSAGHDNPSFARGLLLWARKVDEDTLHWPKLKEFLDYLEEKLESHEHLNAASTTRRMLKKLFSTTAGSVSVFIADVFGWDMQYNTPGSVGPHNWSWVLPIDIHRLARFEEGADDLRFLKELISSSGRDIRQAPNADRRLIGMLPAAGATETAQEGEAFTVWANFLPFENETPALQVVLTNVPGRPAFPMEKIAGLSDGTQLFKAEIPVDHPGELWAAVEFQHDGHWGWGSEQFKLVVPSPAGARLAAGHTDYADQIAGLYSWIQSGRAEDEAALTRYFRKQLEMARKGKFGSLQEQESEEFRHRIGFNLQDHEVPDIHFSDAKMLEAILEKLPAMYRLAQASADAAKTAQEGARLAEENVRPAPGGAAWKLYDLSGLAQIIALGLGSWAAVLSAEPFKAVLFLVEAAVFAKGFALAENFFEAYLKTNYVVLGKNLSGRELNDRLEKLIRNGWIRDIYFAAGAGVGHIPVDYRAIYEVRDRLRPVLRYDLAMKNGAAMINVAESAARLAQKTPDKAVVEFVGRMRGKMDALRAADRDPARLRFESTVLMTMGEFVNALRGDRTVPDSVKQLFRKIQKNTQTVSSAQAELRKAAADDSLDIYLLARALAEADAADVIAGALPAHLSRHREAMIGDFGRFYYDYLEKRFSRHEEISVKPLNRRIAALAAGLGYDLKEFQAKYTKLESLLNSQDLDYVGAIYVTEALNREILIPNGYLFLFITTVEGSPTLVFGRIRSNQTARISYGAVVYEVPVYRLSVLRHQMAYAAFFTPDRVLIFDYGVDERMKELTAEQKIIERIQSKTGANTVEALGRALKLSGMPDWMQTQLLVFYETVTPLLSLPAGRAGVEERLTLDMITHEVAHWLLMYPSTGQDWLTAFEEEKVLLAGFDADRPETGVVLDMVARNLLNTAESRLWRSFNQAADLSEKAKIAHTAHEVIADLKRFVDSELTYEASEHFQKGFRNSGETAYDDAAAFILDSFAEILSAQNQSAAPVSRADAYRFILKNPESAKDIARRLLRRESSLPEDMSIQVENRASLLPKRIESGSAARLAQLPDNPIWDRFNGLDPRLDALERSIARIENRKDFAQAAREWGALGREIDEIRGGIGISPTFEGHGIVWDKLGRRESRLNRLKVELQRKALLYGRTWRGWGALISNLVFYPLLGGAIAWLFFGTPPLILSGALIGTPLGIARGLKAMRERAVENYRQEARPASGARMAANGVAPFLKAAAVISVFTAGYLSAFFSLGTAMPYWIFRPASHTVGNWASSYIDGNVRKTRFVFSALSGFITAFVVMGFVDFFHSARGPVWDHPGTQYWLKTYLDIFVFGLLSNYISFFLMGIEEMFHRPEAKNPAAVFHVVRAKSSQLFERGGFLKVNALYWTPIASFNYYAGRSSEEIYAILVTMAMVYALPFAFYTTQKMDTDLSQNKTFSSRLLSRFYLITSGSALLWAFHSMVAGNAAEARAGLGIVATTAGAWVIVEGIYAAVDRMRQRRIPADDGAPATTVSQLQKNMTGIRRLRAYLNIPHYNPKWHREGGEKARLKDHLQAVLTVLNRISDGTLPAEAPYEDLWLLVREFSHSRRDDLEAAILTHDLGKATPWEFGAHEEASYFILSESRAAYKGAPISEEVKFTALHHDRHWRMDYGDPEEAALTFRNMRLDWKGDEASFDRAARFMIAFSTVDALAAEHEEGVPSNIITVKKFLDYYREWRRGTRLSKNQEPPALRGDKPNPDFFRKDAPQTFSVRDKSGKEYVFSVERSYFDDKILAEIGSASAPGVRIYLWYMTGPETLSIDDADMAELAGRGLYSAILKEAARGIDRVERYPVNEPTFQKMVETLSQKDPNRIERLRAAYLNSPRTRFEGLYEAIVVDAYKEGMSLTSDEIAQTLLGKTLKGFVHTGEVTRDGTFRIVSVRESGTGARLALTHMEKLNLLSGLSEVKASLVKGQEAAAALPPAEDFPGKIQKAVNALEAVSQDLNGAPKELISKLVYIDGLVAASLILLGPAQNPQQKSVLLTGQWLMIAREQLRDVLTVLGGESFGARLAVVSDAVDRLHKMEKEIVRLWQVSKRIKNPDDYDEAVGRLAAIRREFDELRKSVDLSINAAPLHDPWAALILFQGFKSSDKQLNALEKRLFSVSLKYGQKTSGSRRALIYHLTAWSAVGGLAGLVIAHYAGQDAPTAAWLGVGIAYHGGLFTGIRAMKKIILADTLVERSPAPVVARQKSARSAEVRPPDENKGARLAVYKTPKRKAAENLYFVLQALTENASLAESADARTRGPFEKNVLSFGRLVANKVGKRQLRKDRPFEAAVESKIKRLVSVGSFTLHFDKLTWVRFDFDSKRAYSFFAQADTKEEAKALSDAMQKTLEELAKAKGARLASSSEPIPSFFRLDAPPTFSARDKSGKEYVFRVERRQFLGKIFADIRSDAAPGMYVHLWYLKDTGWLQIDEAYMRRLAGKGLYSAILQEAVVGIDKVECDPINMPTLKKMFEILSQKYPDDMKRIRSDYFRTLRKRHPFQGLYEWSLISAYRQGLTLTSDEIGQTLLGRTLKGFVHTARIAPDGTFLIMSVRNEKKAARLAMHMKPARLIAEPENMPAEARPAPAGISGFFVGVAAAKGVSALNGEEIALELKDHLYRFRLELYRGDLRARAVGVRRIDIKSIRQKKAANGSTADGVRQFLEKIKLTDFSLRQTLGEAVLKDSTPAHVAIDLDAINNDRFDENFRALVLDLLDLKLEPANQNATFELTSKNPALKKRAAALFQKLQSENGLVAELEKARASSDAVEKTRKLLHSLFAEAPKEKASTALTSDLEAFTRPSTGAAKNIPWKKLETGELGSFKSDLRIALALDRTDLSAGPLPESIVSAYQTAAGLSSIDASLLHRLLAGEGVSSLAVVLQYACKPLTDKSLSDAMAISQMMIRQFAQAA